MRRLLPLLALVAALLPGAIAPAAADVDIRRVSGDDRIGTAVRLSADAFPAGGASEAVIASAQTFADALAGTPLAAAVGGPLLLTDPDTLSDRVTAELDRLEVETVHLMGGTAAIGRSVENALRDQGRSVFRVAGPDRFATAAAAADAAIERWRGDGDAGAGAHALVALGTHPSPSRAWPDALAAGVLAGTAHRPILLVAPDTVPDATAGWMDANDPSVVTIVGGTAAIPPAVAQDVGDADTDRRRIGGTDRYDTARLLADEAVAVGASPSDVTVATGRDFPDALAAGAATIARGGVMMLVDGVDLDHSPAAEAWLADNTPGRIVVAGGRVAVATGVTGQLDRAVDGFVAPALRRTAVVSGLGTILGAVTAPGDGRLHIWTRQGQVYALGAGGPQLVLDIATRVSTSGEGGLLGLAFPADHGTSGRFFAHYTAPDPTDPLETRLVEFNRRSTASATASSERRLFTLRQRASNHNGGTITFAPDGTLLMFLGDEGGGGDTYDNGQNPDDEHGAVLRFDVSVSGRATPAGAGLGGPQAPSVWMYGLRNPFRADVDPVTNLLHIADVGQSDWEEVDVVAWDAAGTNFGWSVMEGDHCFGASTCDRSGLTPPVVEYSHDDGCSITGGHVYRGDIGMLRGHYVYGDFCSGIVRSFRYDDGAVVEETDWTAQIGGDQVWSFGRDADGEIYLSTGDTLYRIDLA